MAHGILQGDRYSAYRRPAPSSTDTGFDFSVFAFLPLDFAGIKLDAAASLVSHGIASHVS
jgi:hypothetical protein